MYRRNNSFSFYGRTKIKNVKDKFTDNRDEFSKPLRKSIEEKTVMILMHFKRERENIKSKLRNM